MTHTETAGFESVGRMLVELNSDWDAAEAHGAFCGRACLYGAAALKDWAKELGLEPTPADEQERERYRALETVFAQSLLKLESGQMDFRLMVPGDEAPLSHRTVALADWCHGFMQGLASAGGADQSLYTGGVNAELLEEIFADFSEITSASDESGNQGLAEVAEQSFAELAEYVRVSAQLVYEETAGLRKARTRERQT